MGKLAPEKSFPHVQKKFRLFHFQKIEQSRDFSNWEIEIAQIAR
jgi:hypothetical protein